MKVDLHIHSYCSDGKYSPAGIVACAAANGLDIIALTDHDTLDGLHEAAESVRQSEDLTFIPGVELSTCWHTDELHILGYGIDKHHPGLTELVCHAQCKREHRLLQILADLQNNHIHLTLEEVKDGYNASSIGRMHIAYTLIKHGHVRTVREAFERYLSYDERNDADFISPRVAIQYILEAGGIPVFAHPTITLFDRHIDTLVEQGLRGVEVFKGSRPPVEEFYLETVCHDKGLLLTGGSDWHGHVYAGQLGKFYVESDRIQPFLRAVRAI